MAAAKNAAPRGKHAKGAVAAYGSRTDVGLVRDHNEDSLCVTPPLYAVADGMGGHAAGEVASEIAIQTLVSHAPAAADGDELARAVVAANRAIIRAASQGLGRRGMGTTMTAAMLSGRRLVVAQVGDSRAYLLRKDGLQRITRDHSLMADYIESGQITEEEAKTHPQRSVITRALGSDPHTLPDIYEMNVEGGERLLLCSDGLSGMVDDPLLESIMLREKDPQKCANALIEEAIAAGGYDNATAIVVDVPDNSEAMATRERRRGRLGAVLAVAALVLVLIAAVAGGGAYLNHAAFLTIQNGDVVICRGLPGEVMGIQTWQFDQNTGLTADELNLPPNTVSRLTDEGIRVDSVDDALDLVKTWQDQAKNAASDGARTSGDASAAESEGAAAAAAAAASENTGESPANAPSAGGDAS